MLIEKNITFVIQLSAREAYSGQKTIMEKLKQYENICISNALIKKVLSIENMGPRLPVTSNVKGDVQTEVLARVLCLIFNKGDILACKIKFVDPGKFIYGEYEDRVYTNIVNTNENLKMNDLVVVQVCSAIFQQYSTSVTIMCEIYNKKKDGYKLYGEINEDAKKYVETLELHESGHKLAFKAPPSAQSLKDFIQNFKPSSAYYTYSMGKIFEIKDATNILSVDVNIFLASAVDYSKQQSDVNKYLSSFTI